jgi:hypothetical protein
MLEIIQNLADELAKARYELTTLQSGHEKILFHLGDMHEKLEALKKPSTALKFIGMGTCLVDKNDGSKNLSVHLQEDFPTIEGDISPLHNNTEYKGKDIYGNEYKHTLQSNTAIKAIWKEVPNRLTAPDIRVGEQVEVYQAGDGDKYYWSEIGRNKNKRRAEKITIGVNASGADIKADDSVIPHNQYTLDMDGKGGNVTLRTSMDNGEHCKHVVQVDSKKGHVLLTDSTGNQFNMSGKTNSILAKTAAGGTLSINKQDIILQGKTLYLNFDKIIIDGETTLTKKATTNGIGNSGDISTDTLQSIPIQSYKHD